MRSSWTLLSLGLVLMLSAAAGAQEVEAPIRLPPVTISAPARLPGAPLPEASVPATVQTVTGEEIRESGAVTLQDYLRRLPGVTLNDEQGNAFQPGLQLRGFQVSPVTGGYGHGHERARRDPPPRSRGEAELRRRGQARRPARG